MYYGAWPVFVRSVQISIPIAFGLLLLFVLTLMWAQRRAERDAWEKQETRKVKAVRR